MSERRIALPDLILLAVTRGMIGFGAGLLLSDRLDRDRRKVVGLALLATGVLSTIPIAVRVFRRRTNHQPSDTEARRNETVATMAD